MTDFIMKVDTGEEFQLSFEQARAIQYKMKTIGGNFPFVQMDDGSVVMLKHIVGFFATHEYDPEDHLQKPVERPVEIAEPTEDSEDAQLVERRQAILDDMMAKSACQHDKQIIYYQTTISKKGKVSRRYFPVCEFCGLRMRYLKAEALPEDVKDAAKEWAEA